MGEFGFTEWTALQVLDRRRQSQNRCKIHHAVSVGVGVVRFFELHRSDDALPGDVQQASTFRSHQPFMAASLVGVTAQFSYVDTDGSGRLSSSPDLPRPRMPEKFYAPYVPIS